MTLGSLGKGTMGACRGGLASQTTKMGGVLKGVHVPHTFVTSKTGLIRGIVFCEDWLSKEGTLYCVLISYFHYHSRESVYL